MNKTVQQIAAEEPEQLTVWDMFNMEVPPDHLPTKAVPARVAQAIVGTHILKNYTDHDMMVRWLHALWNGPKDVEPYGMATIGSSEACMLAGLAHKWTWRQAREGTSKPNMVMGGQRPDHMEKFLRYWAFSSASSSSRSSAPRGVRQCRRAAAVGRLRLVMLFAR